MWGGKPQLARARTITKCLGREPAYSGIMGYLSRFTNIYPFMEVSIFLNEFPIHSAQCLKGTRRFMRQGWRNSSAAIASVGFSPR